MIALGGFLAALQAYNPSALERVVAADTLAPSLEGVRITPAALGTNLLMIGAAGLAFRPLLADPASISA